MKVLIPILIGLLVLGCGKGNQTANTNEGNNTPAKSPKKEAGESTPSKGEDKNSNKTKPSKEITKEDVVGVYEGKMGDASLKISLFGDGALKQTLNGESQLESQWVVEEGEILMVSPDGLNGVFRIGPEGDLTMIATKFGGKRNEIPKVHQYTVKKLKESPTEGDDKNSTKTKSSKEITKEDVVGSYIRKSGSKTRKLGLLENGKVESYLDDDKVREGSWMIAGNEVHINLIGLSVWRIESNGDLTAVASIKDEKREEAPIDRQTTFKKTK